MGHVLIFQLVYSLYLAGLHFIEFVSGGFIQIMLYSLSVFSVCNSFEESLKRLRDIGLQLETVMYNTDNITIDDWQKLVILLSHCAHSHSLFF